ncbi:TetR/AcrR family transcriptional regulator [Streptomyces sp. NPDC021224]|uniref:TetR/AcrR family transcriptional regulator n=1 Tax=unclassified Streptomyces TaxID=2593676 RepID=UPI0037ACC34C
MTGHARTRDRAPEQAAPHPRTPPAPAATDGTAAADAHEPECQPVRPMRRDAARNHQLVVEAAREVFSEFGTDASMELIASRAGVGVGTVYRRFPNKEALVDEIAGLMLRELTEVAARSLTLPDGAGLEAFLRVIGRSLSEHRGYADKLVGHKASCVEVLRDRITELLVQAQQAGRVAAGVELGDVMALIWGLRGIVETGGTVVPDAWRRHLDIQLAGLRSVTVPQDSPPAATREQLRRIGTATADARHRAAHPHG